MADGPTKPDQAPPEPLTSRPPSVEDLVMVCRSLNEQGVRYVVVGGFAIRNAGYIRETGDVDLLVDTSPENEAKLYRSLEVLPDKAVRYSFASFSGLVSTRRSTSPVSRM